MCYFYSTPQLPLPHLQFLYIQYIDNYLQSLANRSGMATFGSQWQKVMQRKSRKAPEKLNGKLRRMEKNGQNNQLTRMAGTLIGVFLRQSQTNCSFAQFMWIGNFGHITAVTFAVKRPKHGSLCGHMPSFSNRPQMYLAGARVARGEMWKIQLDPVFLRAQSLYYIFYSMYIGFCSRAAMNTFPHSRRRWIMHSTIFRYSDTQSAHFVAKSVCKYS